MMAASGKLPPRCPMASAMSPMSSSTPWWGAKHPLLSLYACMGKSCSVQCKPDTTLDCKLACNMILM